MKLSDKITQVQPTTIKNKEGKEFNAFRCQSSKGYDFISFQELKSGDLVALEVRTNLICKIDL